MPFASRDEALAFVDMQQFARRNQTENWIIFQLGERYEDEAKSHGGDRKSEQSKSSGNDSQKPCHLIESTADMTCGKDSGNACHKSESTAERIAADVGKSPRTVRNAATYNRAVKTLIQDGAEKLGVINEPVRATVVKVAAMPEMKRQGDRRRRRDAVLSGEAFGG